ncbi:MAG: N-6 DNA methylase [Lachnospiraceae bacterium]|nr:N-6 DNA methylase [Lachnospiraceae bacterium]
MVIDRKKYGVVYTPDKLAHFVSKLMVEEGKENSNRKVIVLDPACGEGALLEATLNLLGKSSVYCGIDIDSAIINKNNLQLGESMKFILRDFIVPKGGTCSSEYWKEQIGTVNYIIANPPWSSDKIYEKTDLAKIGYTFIDGQYDNYVLFIELCLKLIQENGICAFILPDSIFSSKNKKLRKKLCEETSICVVARLGEKIFKDVNRATSIIVIKKQKPDKDTRTKCFRLNTNERKLFIQNAMDLYECYQESVHIVKQSRFLETEECLFDLDIMESDEQLIRKIERNKINWQEIFSFGRGVEISKTGKVVTCQYCNMAQGFTKKHEMRKNKPCTNCGKIIPINSSFVETIILDEDPNDTMQKIYVGENLHRYKLQGNRYIKLNIKGINYKNPSNYAGSKIIIRKTGLGIDACIDNDGTYISQTIYYCKYLDKNNKIPLEYYLAILNSRVIYYYYIKEYGENEWKSHPYLTKDIIYSLPVKEYTDTELTKEIILLAKSMLSNYDRNKDLLLEKKVMELYGLTEEEITKIKSELNALPDLGAINDMKF